MTDEPNRERHTESAPSREESTGDAALDQRLSQPILQGDKGLDVALVWISGFLIVLMGVIAYSNALAVPFHGDDLSRVVKNTPLHHLAMFAEALDSRWPQPLAMFTLALNWVLTGGNATSFHVINLLIHLANGVLIFLLCRRLLSGKASDAIAMVAGLLFVLHPANTESVNLAVGRAELLAVFFSLCTLLLFIRAVANEDRLRFAALIVSVVCYALACASSRIALFLPLVVFATHQCLPGARRRRGARFLLEVPYWALLILWVIAGAGGLLAIIHSDSHGPLTKVTGCGTYEFYHLWRIVYPVNLSVWHDPPRHVSLFMDFALIIVGAAALYGLRTRSLVVWGLVVCLFGLAFEFFLSPLTPFISERNLYLPMVGAAMIIPWILARVLTAPPLRVAGGLVSAALVVAAGIGTFLRNDVWTDEPTLWLDASVKAPHSAKPQQELGAYYLSLARKGIQQEAAALKTGAQPKEQQAETVKNHLVAAEKFLTRAKALDAQDAQTLANLGEVEDLLGQRDAAVDNLLAALRLKTQDQSITVDLATALDNRWRASGKHDDLTRALDYFRRAKSLGKLPTEVAARYGLALLAIGDNHGAARVLRAVVSNKDLDSPLARSLKEAQTRDNTIEINAAKVMKILAKQPHDLNGLRLLGQLNILSGHYLEALYNANLVLEQAPHDLAAWIQMGVAKGTMGEADQFLAEFPAPAPAAGNASPMRQLVLTCASIGLWDEGLTYLEKSQRPASAPPPMVELADIALRLKQPRVAWDFLGRATKAYPKDPRPWLRLCDMAIAGKDTKTAKHFFLEAEKRHADPAEMASRRQELGIPKPQPMSGSVKNMIVP